MMNRHFFTAAFALGVMAIVWVAAGFWGTNLLALLMTGVIATVYGVGTLELHRFRQATATLTAALSALTAPPATLGPWLGGVDTSLRNPVRLRIEGERVGLPGPALTPYLVGLLVMLGMLGTFLGMVVTLNGAVFALEGTTDLQAIRSAFSAPMKGLGLAFGTSVAGVASSAMLGLMSALVKRERMQAAQLLDSQMATHLRGFSLSHQRQETFKALQLQSQALPQVVDQLQTLMAQMQQMNQQLNHQLLAQQDSFHQEVKSVYTELARSVDQSLCSSLTQSAQAAGESLKPVVEAAMKGIAQESSVMHERMVHVAQTQLDGLSARFSLSADAVAQSWTAALASHEQAHASLVTGLNQSLNSFNDTFEQHSSAHLETVQKAHAHGLADQAASEQQRLQAWTQALADMAAKLQQEWQHTGAQTLAQQQQICATLTETAQNITAQAHTSASATLGETQRLITGAEALIQARITSDAELSQQHGERMSQLSSMLHSELGALRQEEAQRGQAAVDRLADLQTALTAHLSTLGTALEAPITQLIQTASEAPRAAAEVIGKLRQEVSQSMARDNELLEERSRIMATLNSLLDSIHHASAEQRAVIDALVASSAVALKDAGQQLTEKMGEEAAKLSDIAASVTSSAVEVSTLGETMGFAVRSFSETTEKLLANLQRMEAAMDKSMARSDDQLAYYVAQAREIIDLSLMSQKEIIEELRQLPGPSAVQAQEVTA